QPAARHRDRPARRDRRAQAAARQGTPGGRRRDSPAGEVLLDGVDVYDSRQRITTVRRDIGMVFQKPNPFPAMSIYDNVVAGLKLTGTKMKGSAKDQIVEECLTKAGLWKEVRGRLRQPGGALSGGQQQRLCIARSLAVDRKSTRLNSS